MTSRKITRCRGARGQLALYNPHSVPSEVAQELEGIYGFRPKEATGCLADIMISQRKGEFPPVAFMLIHKDDPEFSHEKIIDRKEMLLLFIMEGELFIKSVLCVFSRLLKAEKAFKNAFAIAVLPIPRFLELQLLAINNSVQIKILPVFSLSGAVKLMVSIHEKLSFEISEKADQLNMRMSNELLTRQHAIDTLRANFPFVSADECDMLLDIFGSIGAIAQAGAEKLLDESVLSTSAAHAIEEFFKTEYAVD